MLRMIAFGQQPKFRCPNQAESGPIPPDPDIRRTAELPAAPGKSGREA